MSTFWKVMIGLVLTLPMAAYVTGTLVASQADMPAERPAIVISDSPTESASPTSDPSPSETRSPRQTEPPKPTARPTDRDDDDSSGRGNADDDVRIVRPTPHDVDDDGDDDGGDDSLDDDSDD